MGSKVVLTGSFSASYNGGHVTTAPVRGEKSDPTHLQQFKSPFSDAIWNGVHCVGHRSMDVWKMFRSHLRTVQVSILKPL
jgi:hypothetical protein